MARIEEKSTKVKNVASKVLLWVAVGFLTAVLIASIVIFILWIVGRNKEEEVKPFVEIYTTAETIKFEDLGKMLDNDEYSELIDKHGKIYVYIYSADEHVEDETTTTAEKLQSEVTKVVDAYNAVKESDTSVAFYIINITHEDNEGSALLSQYATSTLLVFGDEETKTFTSYKDILSGLRAAQNELKPE